MRRQLSFTIATRWRRRSASKRSGGSSKSRRETLRRSERTSPRLLFAWAERCASLFCPPHVFLNASPWNFCFSPFCRRRPSRRTGLLFWRTSFWTWLRSQTAEGVPHLTDKVPYQSVSLCPLEQMSFLIVPEQLYCYWLIILCVFQGVSQRWECLLQALSSPRLQTMLHSPLLNPLSVRLCHPQQSFTERSGWCQMGGRAFRFFEKRCVTFFFVGLFCFSTLYHECNSPGAMFLFFCFLREWESDPDVSFKNNFIYGRLCGIPVPPGTRIEAAGKNPASVKEMHISALKIDFDVKTWASSPWMKMRTDSLKVFVCVWFHSGWADIHAKISHYWWALNSCTLKNAHFVVHLNPIKWGSTLWFLVMSLSTNEHSQM